MNPGQSFLFRAHYCYFSLLFLMLSSFSLCTQAHPDKSASSHLDPLEVSLDRFGLELESLLNGQRMNELNQHFNYPVFLGRVGQNVVSDSVRSRLFGLIGDQRSLFQALSLGSEARYRYKRIIKKGRELRLLFRLMPNPKALEFIEFIVAKNRAGQWQVIDWFQHAQAQLYSQSLVQVYLLLLAPEESTLSRWLSLLPFRNSPSEELLAFFKYAQLKENHKAFRAYERLPSSWQAQSTLMILALNIANRSEDEAQYRRQMARLVSHENNLAEGNLLLLDYYFYLGDHKKALKLIDEAHGLIGEDAQLSLLKANGWGCCLSTGRLSSKIFPNVATVRLEGISNISNLLFLPNS